MFGEGGLWVGEGSVGWGLWIIGGCGGGGIWDEEQFLEGVSALLVPLSRGGG